MLTRGCVRKLTLAEHTRDCAEESASRAEARVERLGREVRVMGLSNLTWLLLSWIQSNPP